MSDASGQKDRLPAVFRGLRVQVAALLALSLLPLGAVAVFQTQALTREVSSRAELVLLDLTTKATFRERQAIERAFGAAEALNPVLKLLREDPASCRDYLQDYLETTSRFSFVGFLPVNGNVTCSSATQRMDLSEDERLNSRMEDPRAWIDLLPAPRISSEPVLNILLPVRESEVFVGYVSISVPVRSVAEEYERRAGADSRPLAVITLNNQAEILLSDSANDKILSYLPEGFDLTSILGRSGTVFTDEGADGREYSYAAVSIIPGTVYALGIWPLKETRPTLGLFVIPPYFPPLLMLIASIAVAYFAVDRFVVRHVGGLRANMRSFAQRRVVPAFSDHRGLSTEIRELRQGFSEMALDLINDEAKLEGSLREKNVLLKEIHHRVKNNLQLISSIMNMQIRGAHQPETVSVLRRVQERVLGLATVHRNLYQAENLSRTSAGGLLRDLFAELVVASSEAGQNVDYRHSLEDITLYPDQALPLSLLASELATNAIKNVGTTASGERYIDVTFRMTEPGHAQLVCENSLGTDRGTADGNESSGLGARLIRAFASQLSGTIKHEKTEDAYRVTLDFKLESFSQEPEDY